MAEPINLAPVRVHAISVPMRPDPKLLHKFDEMMLQANGDDTVHVDIFGTDPQGKPYHESRTVNEQEYEQLRRYHLERELAILPPFSSFKSGNTIGRVVGETAPAAVPASQANPPIEAETEDGEQVLDAVQQGLDVVGLIPVVGEVADIASGVISLARGDYVGAGLSLLSAIPFVGYAGTAGKATRYGAKMAEASGKAAKEVADKAAKETAEKKAKDAAARKQESGGSVTRKKLSIKETKRAQLKRNQKNGKLREQEVEKELEAEGHKVLGTQVSIKTEESRRVIDILIKDAKTGKTRAIEVKSGGAKRSAIQIKKDNSMAEKGGKLIGKNAPKADDYKKIMKIETEVIN